MAKKISQRDAQRMRRRLRALDAMEYERRRHYVQSWPGGVPLGAIGVESSAEIEVRGEVRAARKLGHYVVATVNDDGSITLFAVK